MRGDDAKAKCPEINLVHVPEVRGKADLTMYDFKIMLLYYRKTSSISRTKSLNLNVPCLLLQWSLPNPLKPGVKLRMKM